MKRAVLKWNKSNSEHTECDLRFNDTYHLYKYNIGGINCHHISVKDQKTNEVSQIVNIILDLKTLTIYTSTILVYIIITIEQR